ncbi:YqhA family protein [Vibrio aquaticus]|uniref:YqhA family protein n=1 Tax=Vibrio aquaticus TaxID=2496559 RepID=A0A3S0QDW5_9VIBR|nr:YqhA family protein [Vibrio aquaticus]RTZ16363.1 YqhA family protein [Vibrio aquaticus]
MSKKAFHYFRFISWIAIICSMVGSALLFIIGASKTYTAIEVFLLGAVPSAELQHLDSADIAISYIVKSLDTFLVALVLFIFAHGIYTLFIKSDNSPQAENQPLSWIKTPNIGHLKNKLTEVIIVILFVKFLELVLINFNQLSWEILLLPASILLLSLGVKLLALGQHNE